MFFLYKLNAVIKKCPVFSHRYIAGKAAFRVLSGIIFSKKKECQTSKKYSKKSLKEVANHSYRYLTRQVQNGTI